MVETPFIEIACTYYNDPLRFFKDFCVFLVAGQIKMPPRGIYIFQEFPYFILLQRRSSHLQLASDKVNILGELLHSFDIARAAHSMLDLLNVNLT